MRTTTLTRSEVARLIVAWHDGELLCVRTPVQLHRTQTETLRRMGFLYDRSLGYWVGSAFSKDDIMIRSVVGWGGQYLYTSPFGGDDTMSHAEEIARGIRIDRIMLKRSREEFIVLGRASR